MFRVRAIGISICVVASLVLHAQVQTAKHISVIPNSGGYYEYLPEGYNSGTQQYSLILFIHGMGELGDGSAAQLPRVLRHGPPKLINQNIFPKSFTVNGQTHRFVIISPQFRDWPTNTDINSFINHCIATYRINANRIYLTGLSMGGGVTWEYPGTGPTYANRIAAIVPICGASWPDYTRARNIANANIAVWGTHNDGDPTAPVFYTNDYITHINQPPSPVPPAKKTIFQSNSHDAWTRTYDTSFRENGLNIYEWMLQYARNTTVVLPVALRNLNATNAGAQIDITWTTDNEQTNSHFTISRSFDGVNFSNLINIPGTNTNSKHDYSYADIAPRRGNNYYRLSQTDVNGLTTFYPVLRVAFGGPVKGLVFNPNPVSSTISIHLTHPENGPVALSVSDMQGRLLREWKFIKSSDDWQQVVDMSFLKPGVYMLNLRGKVINETKRLVRAE